MLNIIDQEEMKFNNVYLRPLRKSQSVYLNAFEAGSEARLGIGKWIEYYNHLRPHPTFAPPTPNEVDMRTEITNKAA